MNDTPVHLDHQPADIDYVPAGWHLRRLVEISTSIGDGIHSTPKYVEYSRFSFINGNNLVDGRIRIFGSTKFVGEDEYVRLRINLSSRTILISINGTIGNLALFKGEEVVLGKSAAYINLKKGINRDFVYYYLASRRVSSFFENELTGTTIRNLSLQTLRNTPILLPSKTQEGNRIASYLGHVEDLVFTLERLIAKKQAIKNGIIQQLLSGRTRLPGFTGEWVDRALSELAIVDPENLHAGKNPSEVINYISLEDVNRGELLGSSQLTFKNAPSRARRVIREMDVLFGTVRPNLQSHLIYVGGLARPVASTGFAVVRAIAGRADPRFLFYLVMSQLAVIQIDRIIAGSNYPAVSSEDVRNLRFVVPDLPEQRAIGAALAGCDAELTALRKRLTKAKAVKQGMMQELLTGRTRLPAAEGVA